MRKLSELAERSTREGRPEGEEIDWNNASEATQTLFERAGGTAALVDYIQKRPDKFWEKMLPRLLKLATAEEDTSRRFDGGKTFEELNEVLSRIEEYAASDAPARFAGERPVSS